MVFGAIDWYSCFFMLFAGLACLFAAAVLFSPNIVRMAFFLTLSLGATSGLFFLAGATFVGAMQLMIYVGGTLVLLIFGVMLTAQTPFVSMRTASGEWVLAVIVGSALFCLLLSAAFRVEAWRTPADPRPLALEESQTATAIGAGLSGVRVDRLAVTDPVLRRGMSGYLFPFVIVSVHLLVVLIGAAFLARTKSAGYSSSTATVDASNRARPPALTTWMGCLLAADLIGLFIVFIQPAALRSLSPDFAAAPTWLFTAGGALAALHLVGLLALFSWQRWGFYLACGVAVVSAAAVTGGIGIEWGCVKFFGQVITLAVLYLLLQQGGPRSAWAQMGREDVESMGG